MSKLDIAYDILQDSPASASPVEANFNRIEQHINQELIERGGTVAMAAQLQLVGDPVTPLDAAPKQYVDAVIPIGLIMMYGGVAAPPGGKWALCNGAELESALYPELFAVISTTYSLAGTPAGRFNLPNLVDRFAVGQGAIAGLGKTGGSRDAIIPAHSHSIDHGHARTLTEAEHGYPHTHNGVDHLHRVDIWSGGQNANHTHGSEVGGGQFMTYGVGGAVKAGSGTSIPFVGPYNTAGASNDHAHAINGVSGPADRALTTGAQNQVHQHPFTPTPHTGRSSTEGVAVTDTNLPPYLGVTYIMRVQ